MQAAVILPPAWTPTPSAVTLLVSRPAPPEDTNWVARRAGVQGAPAPYPGAIALTVGFPHLEPAERGRGAHLAVGAQPLPGAAARSLFAPRDEVVAPSTDRLAFTAVITPTPAPQAAVVIPVGAVHATPLERLPLGAVVQGPPVPVPGASAIPIGIVHDGDRLPLGARVQGPPPPVPGALSLPVGAVREPSAIRLPVGIVLVAGQQPMPGAIALSVRAGLEAPLYTVGQERIIVLRARVRELDLRTPARTLTLKARTRTLILRERS